MTEARPSGPRALFRSPLFWAVLIFKLFLGGLLASHVLRDLFIPFTNYFVESGFADPWTHAFQLGRLDAFPYPPVMLYLLAIPRFLLSPLLSSGADTVSLGHLLVARLPLLASDVALAWILARWFPFRTRRILLYYWCSPVLLYVTYWHGQLDLIPTVLFLASLALLRSQREAAAMAMLGVALASKTHLLVAIPFLVSFLRKRFAWPRTTALTALPFLVAGTLMLPYLTRPAFRTMVFATQEQARVFALHIPFDRGQLTVYLVPLALVVLWLRFDGYRKKNWDLLMMYLGLAFSVFVTLAPPRPGYFLWCLPFALYYLLARNSARSTSFQVYSAAYLLFFLLGQESDLVDAWRTLVPNLAVDPAVGPVASLIGAPPAATLHSLFFTVMFAAMGELLLQMYLLGVRSNDAYRERNRPVMVGLAGDSGAGKDRFSGLARGCLGAEQTLLLAGDDYHRWPRGHEMWSVYTHLNVQSNDLQLQQEHALAISAGHAVIKGSYDHESGRFTEQEQVDPRNFVIFQGLHALAMDRQRRLCDLRIFLDPQEDLRLYWKVSRDCEKRDYTPEQVLENLERRSGDREKFILPQRDHAHLVVRYLCPEYRFHPGGPPPPELSLELLLQNSFSLERLASELQDLPNLRVEFDPFRDPTYQRLLLSGDATSEELLALSWSCLPGLAEIHSKPSLESGIDGCLQLVLLLCLSEQLRWGQLDPGNS